MNTWAYTPTTDTAHWYDDSSSFATWIDDLERNPVFYSLCHSTAELKLASWEDFHGNQRTKTRWARHINKTDDITRWKDKHFFSKGYQHTQKLTTSSTSKKYLCKVGMIAKHYWKHSKTNKRLLRVRHCKPGTPWCMIGSSEKLGKINSRCNKRDREAFGCSCQTVLWWEFFQDWLGLRTKASVLTCWFHSSRQRNVTDGKNKMFLVNTVNKQIVLAATKMCCTSCTSPKTPSHFSKSDFHGDQWHKTRLLSEQKPISLSLALL